MLNFDYDFFATFSQNIITDNFLPENLITQNESQTKKTEKKKFKRYDHISCVICGDVSSGLHYGAYTCEACKLFFIRTEESLKQNKHDFNDCQTSICVISVNNRKCAACRYKSCIANGMNLNRRKFGRHANDANTNGTKYVPDLSKQLLDSYKELLNSINNLNNVDSTNKFVALKCQYDIFYEKCKNIIGFDLPKDDETKNNEPIEANAIINTTPNEQIYNFLLLVIFFNLFDVNSQIQFPIQMQTEILKFNIDFKNLLEDYTKALDGNELTLMLKTIIFIIIINSKEIKMRNKELEFIKDSSSESRLYDLLRAEVVLFKTKKEPINEANMKSRQTEAYFKIIELFVTCSKILINQYLKC